MTVTTTPARARDDAADAGAGRPRPIADRTVGRLGAVLAAGALAWAGGMAYAGTDPVSGPGVWVIAATSLAFQLGVLALLTVYRRTRALGTGRVALTAVAVQHVLLAGAVLNTLDPALPFLRGTPWHVVFDLCWPLSMLGMAAVGVRVAIAGRWRGAARVWPVVAESWGLVVIPVHDAFPAADHVVPAAHLLVGYTVLGLVLATRPWLTRRR